MFNFKLSALALLVIVILSGDLPAQGLRGGGGRGGGGARAGGGGGGGRAGGGVSRPAARPSAPNLGASRPSAPSRPNINRPAARPTPSRPSPSNPPQINRPSGGLKPSTRPSSPSLPTSRPENRPSLPATRPGNPSTLPATRPNLPGNGNLGNGNLGNGGALPNRPTTRPSIPNLGGNSIARPENKLPNRPEINRPNLNRPEIDRPNLNRPGNIATRPSPGDLGDFLGMGRPLKPETLPGITRPGIDNRPEIGNRPGIGNRPEIGNRPADRFPNRPGLNDGPRFPEIGLGNNNSINIGNINVGNNVAISNRPSWVNIDRNRVTGINNRWQNQIGGMHNWQVNHPNRVAFWAGWGAGVRSSYRWHFRNPGCFRGSWWYGHPHRWCGWHYGYGFNVRPWRFWWTVPTYVTCVNWFNWSAPPQAWAQPVYYDYGQGGNVVYNDNSVTINGDQIATSAEFAESAADLATVAPPASEEEAMKAEWLALGTFTVSAGEKDVDPTRIVQLAVNKEGIVSGTLYNTETDETQSVQGRVDKETQRVAIRVGENENLVLETGLYNLTQNEAPALVHFGPEKTENWLLVRLEDPAPEGADDADPNQQQ